VCQDDVEAARAAAQRIREKEAAIAGGVAQDLSKRMQGEWLSQTSMWFVLQSTYCILPNMCYILHTIYYGYGVYIFMNTYTVE